MEEFKQRFIETAWSKFGIKAIESINFEQAFAILDEMKQCNIAVVVGQSEQLCPKCGSDNLETADNGNDNLCNYCGWIWA